MSREEKDVHSHAGEHENLAIQKKLYFVSKERERERGGEGRRKKRITHQTENPTKENFIDNRSSMQFHVKE